MLLLVASFEDSSRECRYNVNDPFEAIQQEVYKRTPSNHSNIGFEYT